MEGACHGRNHREQHKRWKEAKDQGEGQPYAGTARVGFGGQAGSDAECLGAGRERLGRGHSPPFRRIERGGGSAQLVKSSPLGGGTQGRGGRASKVEVRRHPAKLRAERFGAAFSDPLDSKVRVEPGEEAGAEQIDRCRCRFRQRCALSLFGPSASDAHREKDRRPAEGNRQADDAPGAERHGGEHQCCR
ncbi:MAG TPA: hypothetical protein VF995_01805 [Actinomycetota bacterium]